MTEPTQSSHTGEQVTEVDALELINAIHRERGYDLLIVENDVTTVAVVRAVVARLTTAARQPEAKAAEERDALLSALGFKPGSFRNELSRKVILDDASGLRTEMVKARRAASAAQADAAFSRWILEDAIDRSQSGLLKRLWAKLTETRNNLASITTAARQREAEGWIVGNANGDCWRALEQGNPVWVEDPAKATRYTRREDAEAVHAEDEDAWCVVPFGGHGNG